MVCYLGLNFFTNGKPHFRPSRSRQGSRLPAADFYHRHRFWRAPLQQLEQGTGITKGEANVSTIIIIESRPSIRRSEEHTSELQSLMRISYAVFCLKKKHKVKLQHK